MIATPLAPFAGFVVATVGGVLSAVAPVVNVHTKLLASTLPARSLPPVVIVAVYTVLAARELDGVKVAVAEA